MLGVHARMHARVRVCARMRVVCGAGEGHAGRCECDRSAMVKASALTLVAAEPSELQETTCSDIQATAAN